MTLKLNQISLNYFLVITCIIGLTSCSKKIVYTAPYALSAEYISTLSYEKQMAHSFVTAPSSRNGVFNSILQDSFYSHDQKWGGEKNKFIEKRILDTSFVHIEPIRILKDDSLVAVHSRMFGDTLRFRWDILRIEQQTIKEHWSNVNDSLGLNPDKHSEIDGPTIPSQLEKTDMNRALVKQFVDQCLIREDGGATEFFNFGLYIQHNRDVGDGVLGLAWEIIKMKLRGGSLKFKDNYHVISEGNLVLSASEGVVDGQKVAFYDLFRIEESKIVEHWDIIAPIANFLNLQDSSEEK